MGTMKKRAASVLVGVGLVFGLAPVAFATNATTVNGATTDGCSMSWDAHSVYSTDASLYPEGLLTNLDGTPVSGGAAGGNGGYVSEVRPEYGGAGIFEVNRFLTGSGASRTLHVRVPLAVDGATESGMVNGTLPDTGNAWTATISPAVNTINRWGSPYSNYSWSSDVVTGVDVTGTSAHVYLYPMASKTGTVVEFTSVVSDDFLKTLSHYSFNFSTNMVDKSACAIPIPSLSQTQVDGDNNDVVTLDPKTTANVYRVTGWNDNSYTVIYTAPDGRFFLDPETGNYVRAISVTLKDNGAWPVVDKEVSGTKDVTRTVDVFGPVTKTATKTVPNMVSRTNCTDPVVGIFQIDSYTPKTVSQVNTIKANSARNVLPYRFDGPNASQLSKVYKPASYSGLWGYSKYTFVTIYASDVKKHGSLKAAIDAKSVGVPNIGGTFGVGKTWTTAWKLASGATVKYPWTSTPTTALSKAQTEYDVAKPAVPVCTTTQVQSGTKTVLYTYTVVEKIGTREEKTTVQTTVVVPTPEAEPLADPVVSDASRELKIRE